MIGGPNPISIYLGHIYKANNRSLSESLARIASGKRILNAADDMVGFLRAAALQIDVTGYENVKVNLTEAKGLADYAEQTGSDIAEDLNRLKELVELYEAEQAGGNDPDVLAAYESEFDALKTTINNTIDNAQYDGIPVVDDSGSLKQIELSPDGSGGAFTIQFTDALAKADITALDITAGTGPVQTQIEVNATYLFEAEAFSEGLERHIDLTDIVINNKEATSSLITDIDEVKELAALIDLQVRQQATVAMIAQANLMRAVAARLYQND